MEVSEEISVQTNLSELGLHQIPSSNGGDSDHETSVHRHVDDEAEIGITQPQYSSDGVTDSATSDLVLPDQIASLELKESEDSSKSDSEDKNKEEEEIGNRSESDRENGNEDENEEEREDSVEKELSEEEIRDTSESDNGNEETVKNENESVKEIEENNGGDETEKKDDKFNARKYQFPVRPDAEDCSFYLKTGNCKFGSHCKFNHPVRRKNNHQATRDRIKEKEKDKEKEKEMEKENEESSEKSGQSECKFYLRSGGCKFGKSCKYYHPRGKASPTVAPVLEFNFVGLPIRAGEKECPYYMRTGSCKYGVNCRFNHPDPTDAAGSDTSVGYSNGGRVLLQGGSQSTIPSWSAPRSINDAVSAPAPFVPMMATPTQGAPSQHAEWNGYQGTVYLPPERNMPPPTAYAMNNLATETNIYKHHSSQNQVDEYPERPGQPECGYFLKTGDCKFKSNCKYHHPKNRGSMKTPCTLSDKGLPLRPDQNICAHYSRYGICKYGPACRYDHPQVNPTPIITGVDNQPPHGHSTSMEVSGMTESGSSSEVTIQQWSC